jgi:hypothetical protein
MFLEKEERKNLIEIKRQKTMAGNHVNNLAGRKSDRGRRPEKEWQIIGISQGRISFLRFLKEKGFWRGFLPTKLNVNASHRKNIIIVIQSNKCCFVRCCLVSSPVNQQEYHALLP